MTISHDETMSAEKSLSWNVLVLQLLNRPSSSFFEVQGSYWWLKKQNEVIYRSIDSFFLIFKKRTTPGSMKFLWTKNVFFFKSIDINIDSVGRTGRPLVCLLDLT